MKLRRQRSRSVARSTRLAILRRDRKAARRRPSTTAPFAAAAGGVAMGGLLEYFLDPRSGRRRRHSVRDRGLSRVRRGRRAATVRARRTGSHGVGIIRRTVNFRRRRAPLDDVTLAHKVESELYRRANLPKGEIIINAEDGVVFVRGVVERQDDIERVAAEARRVDGVRDVENLVHLRGTPAPASRSKLERKRSHG